MEHNDAFCHKHILTGEPSPSQTRIHWNTVIPSVTNTYSLNTVIHSVTNTYSLEHNDSFSHKYSPVNLRRHKHVFTGTQLFLLSQILTGKPSLSQTRIHWNSYSFSHKYSPVNLRSHKHVFTGTQLFLLSHPHTHR